MSYESFDLSLGLNYRGSYSELSELTRSYSTDLSSITERFKNSFVEICRRLYCLLYWIKRGIAKHEIVYQCI
jgi:hypothetical protein